MNRGIAALLQRAHRDGFQRARAIEIGDEPPLRVDGDDPGSSRNVNFRWLASTVLAGVLGIVLLGSAIYTSMDGVTSFAKPGVYARWDPYGSRQAQGANSNRKSDQILLGRGVDEDRQIFRISTTTRSGNREIVRTRPVTRISANLIPAGLDVDIPAFNPLAMFANDKGGSPAEEAMPAADGEVSYTVQNLTNIKFAADDAGPSVTLEDVLSSVRDVAAMSAVSGNDFAGFGDFGGSSSAMASLTGPSAPNMTVIGKKPPRNDSGGRDDERVVTARQNDKLDDVLMRQGATREDARAIASAFGARSGYGTMALQAGQVVRILTAQEGGRMKPLRVAVESGSTESIVALSDMGDYVSVADSQDIAQNEGENFENVQMADGPGELSLYQSFYGTALTKGVPKEIINELVEVFSYDADFQRKASANDGFEVLFASDDAGQVDGQTEILYSSLISGGITRKYYRYQSPEDGTVDYYDEEGRSARKFLMRKPIATGQMRSGFGMRRHPILGYSKMHTGVDFAAPRGTPIYSAGNGTVLQAKRAGGYGNQVKIKHANGYETAYGHMSSFARGLSPGDRVRQGQLIGYVGSTGLSTGNHLHYEVLVNGRFQNPMSMKVPRGKELDGPALAEFMRERDRINGFVEKPSSSAQAAAVARGG